jgi:hypothetical protein
MLLISLDDSLGKTAGFWGEKRKKKRNPDSFSANVHKA